MEWCDDGIVLGARPHGESSAVVHLLTRAHGRHAGLVRGGASRRGRHVVEPGTLVSATWRARLAEHLGHLALEPTRHVGARLLEDPMRLAALNAACTLMAAVLPEREPHVGAFEGMLTLLETLETDQEEALWPAVYVHWELGLLGELGFGLDLTCCAATGKSDDLTFVSPRTGRAVSRDIGAPYAEKLLILPSFLRGGTETGPKAINQGLAITGHFLACYVFNPIDRSMPLARGRLVELLERRGTPGQKD